jgi:simple sugar transport system permease protein
LKRAGRGVGTPIASILFAFIVGAIIVFVTGGDPGQAYSSLVCGGFGIFCSADVDASVQISLTIVYAIPLILTGLAVAFAFRSGLFNIGAEGQLIMGSIVATVIGIHFATAPTALVLPMVLIGGMIAGALYGGIVGALKAWTGAHEVVTTIMLNYIAIKLVDYLVVGGPLQGPKLHAQSDPIGDNATLPLLPGQNLTGVHAGIYLAIAAAVVFWFIMQRTTLGYEVRAVGQSQRAARYAGVSVKRTIIVSMLIAGAFAGLAGAVQIAGVPFHQVVDSTYQTDTTGFDAIAVALLGQNSAIGVVLAAVLFASLHTGGTSMQFVHVSPQLVSILQALILFSIAANLLGTLRVRFTGLSKAPDSPTEEPLVSPTVAAEPEHVAPADVGGGA